MILARYVTMVLALITLATIGAQSSSRCFCDHRIRDIDALNCAFFSIPEDAKRTRCLSVDKAHAMRRL